ncbi:MAG: hypothetical protein HS130_03735 [Deltaproteobacteria bacterium]|nr:hypothetical protein [Deltaproteobacteria bacterium]MCL4874320.1 hypothetical protein [bacterium]
MGLLAYSIPVLFFLVSGCELIDSVIVIEPKKETRAMAAGSALAKKGALSGGCADASGRAPVPCGDLGKAGRAGYEDGSFIKPIPENRKEDGASEQGSGFASLMRKLVKTGMRLYAWPEAD